MWISKQEYEEGGKSCVDKKCPWLFAYIFFYLSWTVNCFKACGWWLWRWRWCLLTSGYSLVQQSVEIVKRVYFIYLLPSDWATSENASNVFSVGWVYSVSLCEREILWKILKYLLWINHLHFQKKKKHLRIASFMALLTVLLRLQAEHIWD